MTRQQYTFAPDSNTGFYHNESGAWVAVVRGQPLNTGPTRQPVGNIAAELAGDVLFLALAAAVMFAVSRARWARPGVPDLDARIAARVAARHGAAP